MYIQSECDAQCYTICRMLGVSARLYLFLIVFLGMNVLLRYQNTSEGSRSAENTWNIQLSLKIATIVDFTEIRLDVIFHDNMRFIDYVFILMQIYWTILIMIVACVNSGWRIFMISNFRWFATFECPYLEKLDPRSTYDKERTLVNFEVRNKGGVV